MEGRGPPRRGFPPPHAHRRGAAEEKRADPTPALDVFAANISALEETETKAATRALGAVALRDAMKQTVKGDLGQLRSYVQSVVATTKTARKPRRSGRDARRLRAR